MVRLWDKGMKLQSLQAASMLQPVSLLRMHTELLVRQDTSFLLALNCLSCSVLTHCKGSSTQGL